MNQGRWVASSELEGPGVQPQVGEQGRSVGYAQSERGLDRTLLRKGSFSHPDVMGTSQQLTSTPHKAETLDVIAGSDLISPRPVTVRTSSNYGGSIGPPVVTTNNSTRALSRPLPPPFTNTLSPRTCLSTSYRDVVIAASQHGLSAYAHSATAVAAAAIRGCIPRSGGGAAAMGGGISSAAATGRPPPAPRPTQHSAPTPVASGTPNSAAAEFLPSCSGASPIRGSIAATRGLPYLPSRGSAPSPNSPGHGGDISVSTGSSAVASHLSGSDMAMITVTSNDVWWRGAFEGSVEPEDPLAGTSSGISGTAGAMRVMSPGWGAAPPSVYEADGRPGTRGGGPQYDIEGRPTTRSGQRPPSRAQLSLSQQRPPAHVAPLVGQGWAGLFAGSCGTVAAEALQSATSPSPSPPPLYASSPRVPSAGGSISWNGDVADPQGSLRRQRLQLTPPNPGATTAARLSSPPARVFGNMNGGGGGGSGGILSSLPPQSLFTASASVIHTPQGFQASARSPLQQLASVGSVGSSSNSRVAGACVGGGGTRAQLSSKLSSIAEAPGSPVLLPLPPQLQQQQQPSKSSTARADGGSMGARKASRVREGGFVAIVGNGESQQSLSLNMALEEVLTDDSRRANVDQDAGSRGAGVVGHGRGGRGNSGGGGGGGGGGGSNSGRARLRRSSSNVLSTGPPGPSGYLHGQRLVNGDLAGLLQSPSGRAAQTGETPSTRPRR